jgi:hypothetical protein
MLKDLFTPNEFKALEDYAVANNISNYEALRRVVSEWNSGTTSSKPVKVQKVAAASTKPKEVKTKREPVVVSGTSADHGLSVADIGLPTRAKNALLNKDKLNAPTVGHMLRLSEEDIKAVKGLGAKTIEAILEAQKSFGGGSVEVSVPEPQKVVDTGPEYTYGVLEKFDSFEGTKQGLTTAIKLYRSIDGEVTKEDTFSLMKEAGWNPKDPSTYADAIVTLRENLPIQGEQVDMVRSLGEKLGESDFVLEEERPVTAFGNKLSELLVGEADIMIADMEADLKEFQSDEIEETVSDIESALDDDFFD